jgi:UDP-glucose-4-epimerase GalE
VTGGAGYVGSHAAKALRRAGRRVVLYDDLSAGHTEAALGAPLIVADAGDVDAVRRAIRDSGARAVMHFAARLEPAESVRDPLGYFRSNVVTTLATLEAMVAEGCQHFVLSSTCAVYGEPTETPITEIHPTAPVNPYGETKLAIERALPYIERAHGIRSVCLRYFNAAGADPDGELGEDHHPEIHLIPRAFDAIRGGPAVEVFGTDYPTPDGTCLRDYVHVRDLAEAHVLALERLEHGGESATYNLGTEQPSSVLTVLEAVGGVAGTMVPRRAAARRLGDPAVLYASARRARDELGWVARRADLGTIVADAWRWHVANPDGYGLEGAG